MEVLSTRSQLEEKMARQRVLPKEAMKPNFIGVDFQCGCGEKHAASDTPHIYCGSLNEFFHQCSNRFVTLVKYKGFFRTSAVELWSCHADIFWDLVDGKKELSKEDETNALLDLSKIVSKIASVDGPIATTYAEDFRNIYIDGCRDGENPEWTVVWGAILHLCKMAGLENAQAKFLASRAPDNINCPRAEEITIRICEYASANLSGDMKAQVDEALAVINR